MTQFFFVVVADGIRNVGKSKAQQWNRDHPFSDWMELTDPKTKKPYWFNSKKNKRVDVKPLTGIEKFPQVCLGVLGSWDEEKDACEKHTLKNKCEAGTNCVWGEEPSGKIEFVYWLHMWLIFSFKRSFVFSLI